MEGFDEEYHYIETEHEFTQKIKKGDQNFFNSRKFSRNNYTLSVVYHPMFVLYSFFVCVFIEDATIAERRKY